MSKRHDKFLICDMLVACKKILEHSQDISFESFLSDTWNIDAFVRNIEIIGEAACKISEELKTRYSHIQWKHICATRNRLIHGYFDIGFHILFDIIINEIPKLYHDLKDILKAEGWECDI